MKIAQTSDIYARANQLTVASGAACSCGWDTGAHEPRCALVEAWRRALDRAEAEAEHDAEEI